MKIQEEIEHWKKKRNAVILAHYYTRPEIQQLADYVGDSLYLSKIAASLTEQTLVFCGVKFMGESAKLLCPDKNVLMPDQRASCPMAHMCTKEIIDQVRRENTDVAVVCYINSTAALKACSDVCVTSSHAYEVVNALPQKNIFFISDRNLGHYLAEKMPHKHFIFNKGFCPIHERITVSSLREAKEKHPTALVLAHPECRAEVLNQSDFVGSTSQIIQFAKQSDVSSFIVCTEIGVSYALHQAMPDKQFYFPSPEPICHDMKRITPSQVLSVLKTSKNSILMSEEQMLNARPSLDRMMELSK
jgi:quinolinate synthase